MSRPYSVRMGTGADTTGAAAVTIGTCPAGKRWILRDWVWGQTGSGSARGRINITALTGNTDLTPLMAQNDVHVRSERHVVVLAGEAVTFRAQNITGSIVLTLQVFGYELDAP